MKNKIQVSLYASLLVFTACSYVFAGRDDEMEPYKNGITRGAVVSAAVAAGTWLGEQWAVDITTKVITKSVQSSPSLFNMAIGSAIRGQTLIEAIPVAAKRGAYVGAIGTAFLAPIAWDCGNAVANSSKKIYRTFFEENLSTENKATSKDYVAVGAAITSLSTISYMIFKY